VDDLNSLSPLAEYESELYELGKKAVRKDPSDPTWDCSFAPEWDPLEDIVQLPEINDSFFASWKSADIPVILLAGLAGALGSYFTRDFFAEMHDNWGRTSTTNGGHGGEPIDRVPGSDQSGGWGHRWEYGHDLLNPFEVDWDEYMKIAQASGTVLPVWMKAAFYWVRHLFQDSFSKEGLPLPGHSYFLRFLNWLQHLLSGGTEGKPWIDPKRDNEMLKIFGTIKMRDVAGTALTTIIMKLYLWGTEDSWKEANSKQNYRTCSLMLGAYWVNLCVGLMVPQKAKTLNIPAIPLIARYLWALLRINSEVSGLLQSRDKIIQGNWVILARNDERLDDLMAWLKKRIKDLDDEQENLTRRYNELFPEGE
jgi:hypothetical protein